MSGMRDMSAFIASVKESMDAGQMLEAWEIAREFGVPLANWPHGEARRQAARLAFNLGDRRLAQVLDWLNWHQERDHPKWYFHALFPRAAWATPQEILAGIDNRLKLAMPDDSRAELLAYQAWSHAMLRDFTPAHDKIAQALKLIPDNAWLHVQHSAVLEAHDRLGEALEKAKHALNLRPNYRSAVLQCANVLVHLGRDEEALAEVEKTHGVTQHADFAIRMQLMHSERGNHAHALRWLEEAERLSPLATGSWKKWAAGRRADFLYLAGDFDGCLEWCDRKGEGFQKRIAEALRKPGARERKRVKLDVPFVRQHHMTCAPATLSALAAYWRKKHDHLEIADAICHEGTPWHKERAWAESHGFVAREFRVTREILHGLIDRGVPFTLTTQWTTGAHLQACIGYDDRTGAILLRDPTERHYGEMILESLIEDHPVDGPRGMVMVPDGEERRLDGLSLPFEAAYEANYRLLVALDGHDRWKLEAALATLRAVAPESALALQGEARVAAYLRDWARELAATEALLERAPGYGPLLMRKSFLLSCLGRRSDQRALLEQTVGKESVFASELGELLLEDARELPLAAHFLKRALRKQPGTARCHESLARCREKQHRHEEAAGLRRAASALAPDFEGYARGYFDTCRVLKRTREALEFLRERTRVHGRKDSGPWITLASCLDAVRNDREAVAVLEQAREARAEDGEFLLEAGAMMAGWGGELRERGLRWIDAARGKVAEAEWLRKSARTFGFLGERRIAIQHWRTLLASQPLAIDGWRALIRLVAEEDGEDAAMALLDEAVTKHPDQTGLWGLMAEWRRDRPAEALVALDRLLALDPRDRWALRERALRRLDVGRKDEALADMREAVALDPREQFSHGILASVFKALGIPDEARNALKEALRLSIDYTWAARELMDLAPDRAASLEVLSFINTEMRRQVSDGSIVPVYQELAWRLVEPPVLLNELQDFCKERPDLWQTWSARIEQALRMGFDGEAMAAAVSLTESFPLLPRGWLDLAKVHRAAGRHVEEERAVAAAIDLSPGWDEAARLYAEVLERLGRLSEAETVLRRALSLEPFSGANYGVLADFLRRLGRRNEASALLVKASDVCPFYSWGWETLARWTKADGRCDELAERLRAAGARHGHRKAWWTLAADAWDALGQPDESIAAIRRGLELAPDDVGLRDQLVCQLAVRGKHDEAMASCAAIPGEERPPRELEGRRAWLLMQVGRPVEAIAAMQVLLEREPDYTWGANELAEWLSRRHDWQRLCDLCRAWVRHAPRASVAFGYLGQAEHELGNMEAAMAVYARAYALDPEYVFAGRQLADIQMHRGEFDQAAATIAQLRHYVSGPYVTCDAIELMLKRCDWGGALKEAEKLVDDIGANTDNFEWAGELFRKAGREAEWSAWLDQKLRDTPVPAPGALVAYLQNLPASRVWKIGVRRIMREIPNSESRVQAWRWLICHAGKLKHTKRLKAWSTKAYRQEIYEHPVLWNSMGSSLLDAGAFDEGAKWLAGWEHREADVNASTLVILAAHYEAGSGEPNHVLSLAADVRRAGLARFPSDPNAPALRAGLALWCAIEGRIDEAKELLGQFEPELTVEYYRQCAGLAESIVASAEDRHDEAADTARKAIRYFVAYPNDIAMKRLYKKSEFALARYHPSARGKVSRLRKSWNLPNPKRQQAASGDHGIPKWAIMAIAAAYILASLRACSG